MIFVWVTNTGTDTLTDGWDGERFEFAPGSTVKIPLQVAVHVFGFKDENKEPYLARLGWVRTSKDTPEALVRLEKFVISSVEPPPYHVASPVVAFPPSHASRRGRGAGTK